MKDMLTERGEEEEEEGKEEEELEEEVEELEDPIEKTDDILRAHFFDAGLIYTHEGKDKWVNFVCRSYNYDVRADDPLENGIYITWKALGPSDEDLLACKDMTGCDVREFQMQETETTIFFPSPKPLCQDISKVEKRAIPDDNPRWLVVTIPFRSEEPHTLAELCH